jgi:hypothetical protein
MDTAPRVTCKGTVGPRGEQRAYTSELAATAAALQGLLAHPAHRNRIITILTSNLSVLLAINRPRQQSRQASICQTYDATRKLKLKGNCILAIWALTQEEVTLRTRARAMAKQVTEQGQIVQEQRPSAKVYCTKFSNSEAGARESTTTRGREVHNGARHYPARQAHSTSIRQFKSDRSKRTYAIAYRDGTTQQIPISDRSSGLRPVCVWANLRAGKTLPSTNFPGSIDGIVSHCRAPKELATIYRTAREMKVSKCSFNGLRCDSRTCLLSWIPRFG